MIAAHFRTQYANTWRYLLNQYDNRPILWDLIDKEQGSGDVYMIDSSGPATDIETRVETNEEPLTLLKDKKTRATFEQLSAVNQTVGELKDLLVPHIEYQRQRTVSQPAIQEWGHWLDPDKNILDAMNPQGHIMQHGATDMKAQCDKVVREAIFATAVNRTQADGKTIGSVAFTNTLEVPIGVGNFNRRIFSAIRRTFVNNGLFNPSKIYCLISPEDWEQLFNTEVELIMNKDFTDPAQHYFETGKLPHILNIQVMEHDKVAQGEFYAWRKEGIVGVDYGGGQEYISQSDEFKQHIIMYKKTIKDAKRVDDKCVVHGSVVAAP